MLANPNGTSIYIPQTTPKDGVTFLRLPATTTPRHGRIYLFHGLAVVANTAGPFNFWQTDTVVGLYGSLLTSLRAAGWECVIASDPADFIDPGYGIPTNCVNPNYWDIRDDPAGGQRVVNTILASIDSMVDKVTALYGQLPSLFMGASWGAWTSAKVILNRPKLADGVAPIGMCGVIAPHQLGNYVQFGGYLFPFPTPGLDLADHAFDGVTLPCRFSVGSQDTTAFPFGTDTMVQNAIAAGANMWGNRTVTDGVITGGTSFSSATACLITSTFNNTPITGPGIPGGTTLSGYAGGINGPWTGTLSQTCTNGSGLTCVFPKLGPAYVVPHGMSPSDQADILTWLTNVIDPLYPAVL